MKHFVMVFDRHAGQVLSEDEFTDPRAAMQERFAVERQHRHDPEIEVVVLGADSAQMLRTTHARYFHDVASLARRGAEIIRASA
ncbi:MAG: hypothetical protein ACRCYX_04410 [Dermatophilaceae bacterium]